MKKISKMALTMLAFVFCFATALICTACGKAKIARAYVKSGLETVVARSDDKTLDTSNVIVTLVYSDKKTKEVNASVLEFSEIDLKTISKQKMTITYTEEDYSFEVEIEVVATDADVYAIEQMESKLLNEFNAKRNATGETSEFCDKNQPLYVGNDNKFDLRIVASGVNGSGEQVDEIKKLRTKLSIWKVVGRVETLLEGQELENTVEYDNINTYLKFKDSVVDKTFKIRITPERVADEYAEDCYIEATFTVVDGWNVYDAKDLSLYDNTNIEEVSGNGGAWTALKQEWGFMDKDGNSTVNVNALILQSDIAVVKEYLPRDYFWHDAGSGYNASQNYADVYKKVTTDAGIEFVGTPIDRSDAGLYTRQMNNGDTFNFIGNYFQIDLSMFPKMVVEFRDADPSSMAENAGAQGYVSTEEGKELYITAHLCVFYSQTLDETVVDTETQVNWKNFNFNGNGAISKSPANSGAICLMKNRKTNYYTYNTITNNFYIGYFFEGGNKFQDQRNEKIGTYIVDSCKGYNSYQSLFYLWGADNMIIKYSEFKWAGGPAIIADHAQKDGSDINTGYIPKIDIIKSTVESVVTSKSFWFSNYGMSPAAAQIATSEQLFDGSNSLLNTGKTIFADAEKSAMNIPVVLMGGQGYARFFKTEGEYNDYYSTDPKVVKPSVYGLDLMRSTEQMGGQNLQDIAMSEGSIFFESSGNGGVINSNVETNGMTTTGYLKVESLYAGLCSINSAFKVEGWESLDFNVKKATLCQLVACAEQASAGSIQTVYGLGYKNGWFKQINTNGKTNADLLSAVQAQISAWELREGNYHTGEYINLYTNLGIGVMIGLYDKETA